MHVLVHSKTEHRSSGFCVGVIEDAYHPGWSCCIYGIKLLLWAITPVVQNKMII